MLNLVTVLHFDRIPLWAVMIMACGAGSICAIVVKIFFIPWQRKTITGNISLCLMLAD